MNHENLGVGFYVFFAMKSSKTSAQTPLPVGKGDQSINPSVRLRSNKGNKGVTPRPSMITLLAAHLTCVFDSSSQPELKKQNRLHAMAFGACSLTVVAEKPFYCWHKRKTRSALAKSVLARVPELRDECQPHFDPASPGSTCDPGDYPLSQKEDLRDIQEAVFILVLLVDARHEGGARR